MWAAWLLEKHLGLMEESTWTTLQKYELTWTSPSDTIVKSALRASEEALCLAGLTPVANMRVGESDTRIFRLAGMPVLLWLYPVRYGR
jgi:hypothetical protein